MKKPSSTLYRDLTKRQEALKVLSGAKKAQEAIEQFNAMVSLLPMVSPLPTLPAPNLSGREQVIQNPSDFGTLLKVTRKAQGLTQQQFADLSGVGRRFIVECEAGKPRLEFAKVLQVAASAGIDIIAKKR